MTVLAVLGVLVGLFVVLGAVGYFVLAPFVEAMNRMYER